MSKNPYEAPQAALDSIAPSSNTLSASWHECAFAIFLVVMQGILLFAGFPDREYLLILAIVLCITGIAWAMIHKKYWFLTLEFLLLLSSLIALYLAPELFIMDKITYEIHYMPHPLADCWFLTGSTASGKSAFGVHLARELNGEILSLDSMAIYRHMDIGTAKPSVAEQGGIPHYLLDIRDPHEEFSVAQYRTLALQTVDDIRTRGKTPIFVGGTPLYLKVMLRGFFEGPPADWTLRGELEEEARAKSWDTLYTRLEQVDPAAALRIERNDQRRIVRALEVFELTGTPLSDLQREFERETPAAELRVFILDWPRPIMHQRINARVEQMIAAGLIAETEQLLKLPDGLGRTALQAVGYTEIREYLSGQKSLQEAILRIQARTRQFAKRQMTWFRSLGELRWVTMDTTKPSDAVLQELLLQGKVIAT